MKVIQITPCLLYGDGVGNDVVAMDRLLKKYGYDTDIYTMSADKRLKHLTKDLYELPVLGKKDIVLYHMAAGSECTDIVKNLGCFKVLIYHNITPAWFYEDYNSIAAKVCAEGIEQVKKLASTIDYCIADSDFNANDLRRMGYTCHIERLPIIIPFGDYKKDIDEEVFNNYNDECTNIVFTGRVVPNKKQEDIIKAFYYYNKYWNKNSRLILVGGFNAEDKYCRKLAAYVKEIDCKNVVFTGHISFAGILACYSVADVFLCMSEHEGFCIPILEAMTFQKPIIAYNSTAVPETMGKNTMVVDEKNYLEIAGLIDRIVRCTELREQLVHNQNRRLADFDAEKVEKRFVEIIESIQKIVDER